MGVLAVDNYAIYHLFLIAALMGLRMNLAELMREIEGSALEDLVVAYIISQEGMYINILPFNSVSRVVL